MSFDKVKVVFYSEKMLKTIDLSMLLNTIFKYFGVSIVIEFSLMTERQRSDNSENVDGILIVKKIVQIYLLDKINEVRQIEIENEIINFGQK